VADSAAARPAILLFGLPTRFTALGGTFAIIPQRPLFGRRLGNLRRRFILCLAVVRTGARPVAPDQLVRVREPPAWRNVARRFQNSRRYDRLHCSEVSSQRGLRPDVHCDLRRGNENDGLPQRGR
jgi:hypothetical protein